MKLQALKVLGRIDPESKNQTSTEAGALLQTAQNMIVKIPRVLKKKTLSKDIYANRQRVRAHLRESMEAWSKMCECNFDSIYIRDWDWVAFRAVKSRNNWWLSCHSDLGYICRPSQCPGKHGPWKSETSCHGERFRIVTGKGNGE